MEKDESSVKRSEKERARGERRKGKAFMRYIIRLYKRQNSQDTYTR